MPFNYTIRAGANTLLFCKSTTRFVQLVCLEVFMNNEVETISVEDAAKIMHVTPQFIRESLKQGSLPIGTAVRMPGGRYSYLIIKRKLWSYLELGVEDGD